MSLKTTKSLDKIQIYSKSENTLLDWEFFEAKP